MALRPYFDNITSQSFFEKTFKSNKPIFSSLADVGASKWGRQHLIACRVIRRTAQPNVLQIFSEYQPDLNIKSIPEIASFVAGPGDGHMNLSEQHLVRSLDYGISLGQVWAALATFKGNERRRGPNVTATPPGSPGFGTEPTSVGFESGIESPPGSSKAGAELPLSSHRIRTKRSGFEDFSNSSEMQVGSSPLADGSSQDSQDSQSSKSSVGHLDAESHRLVASSEDATVRLISSVIRHILYFIQPDNLLHVTSVAEFRDEKLRLSVTLPNTDREITAIDDGGICLRSRCEGEDTFEIYQNHAAILEAKRQFQCVINGQPIISDKCFAQMTCEALLARSFDPLDDLSGSERVLVINATQHFVCFLDFEISNEYLRTFGLDGTKDFLHVNSTPWFDLSSKSGREQVVRNIYGIMRWSMDQPQN